MFLEVWQVNKERMAKFISGDSINIVDAMERIDKNCAGVLFIVNEKNELIGCITDGDIRRWILKAGSINASIDEAMSKLPYYLLEGREKAAESLMKEKCITALPILNDKKQVTNVILRNEETTVLKEERDSLCGVPVVVMAGGKGTRLYPYTKILPKPLIPIGDTPIVERIINGFTYYGIDKFYMTVNYKKGMIKSYFTDLNPKYTVDYVEEAKPLGTGGSIKLIRDHFDCPVFVTNCDSLILTDYADLYEHHKKMGNDITMVSALKNMVVPYGVIHFGDNGEIENIEEKPKFSYFINTGMYVINPEVIALIPDDTLFHMTHLVDAVMKSGGKVGTYPISEDSFLDMGELSEMKRMEEKLQIVVEEK